MTPRDFIQFFRTRTGAFLLFLILIAIGYILVNGFKAPNFREPEKSGNTGVAKKPAKAQLMETVMRAMAAFHPPQASPTPSPPAPAPKIVQPEKPKSLPPISLYAAPQNSHEDDEPLGQDYAPFGRLVQCELVVTVDSSLIDTPIIGLVTDDVWHHGRLIIPAGTEVHGTAKVDHVRERIASSGNWTLVWQTGEELTVSGIALDRERNEITKQNGDTDTWGITDGSAGLRGELLKSDDLAEIKLFAATFLSGAASGLAQQEQTIFGTQAVPSLQNAPLAGAQQVLNAYAQQILQTIERDGFYVRVPAGKQFYLYVTQTIDLSKAVIGGSRVHVEQNAGESHDGDATSDPLVRLRNNLQRITSPVSASPAAAASPANLIATPPALR